MDRIEYQLTERDQLEFLLYFSANSETQKRLRRRSPISVALVYLGLGVFFVLFRAYPIAIAIVAFGTLWFCFFPARIQRRTRKYFEKHIKETVGDSLQDPVSLELQPDGIIGKNHLGESKCPYSAVDHIAENDGYTYVFLGKDRALILPHDRIPHETLAELVAEIARRKQLATEQK